MMLLRCVANGELTDAQTHRSIMGMNVLTAEPGEFLAQRRSKREVQNPGMSKVQTVWASTVVFARYVRTRAHNF